MSDAWLSNNFYTYILLKPGANAAALQSKFGVFLQLHAGQRLQTLLHMDFAGLEKTGNYFRLSLTPLMDIHLQFDRRTDTGRQHHLCLYLFGDRRLYPGPRLYQFHEFVDGPVG